MTYGELSPEVLYLLTEDPRRLVRKLPPSTSLLDRVLLRCELDLTGCWLWPKATAGGGYASLRMGGHTYYGHHVAYDALRGQRSASEWTDHLCRRRHCCNPWHIEMVPPGENTRRGWWANGHPRATHCALGHAYAEVGVYAPPNSRARCATCQRRWLDTQNTNRRRIRALSKT